MNGVKRLTLIFLCFGTAVLAIATSTFCTLRAMAATSGAQIAEKIHGVWSSPPERLPSGAMPGGAYLGNGDLGVVVGGAADDLDFYIGKSDFFGVLRGYIMPAGSLRIDIPQLAHATEYHLSQNLGTATVTGQFASPGGVSMRMKSWVTRRPNMLVIQLNNIGTQPLSVQAPLLNAWDTGNANQSTCTGQMATMAAAPDSVRAVAGNRLYGGPPAGFDGDIKYVVIERRSAVGRRIPLYGWRWSSGKLLRDKNAASDTQPVSYKDFHGTSRSDENLGVIRMPQRGFVWSAVIRTRRTQTRAFIFSATLSPHPPRRYPYHRGFAVAISRGRVYTQLNRTAIEAGTPLPENRWVKVKVQYDVKSLKLWVGGRLAARTVNVRRNPLILWKYRRTSIRHAPRSLPLTGVAVGHQAWRTVPVGTDVFHRRAGYAWFQTRLPLTVKPGDSLHFTSVAGFTAAPSFHSSGASLRSI